MAESNRKIEALTREIRDLKKKNDTLEATAERLRRENIIAKSFQAPPRTRRGEKTPEILSRNARRNAEKTRTSVHHPAGAL